MNKISLDRDFVHQKGGRAFLRNVKSKSPFWPQCERAQLGCHVPFTVFFSWEEEVEECTCRGTFTILIPTL